MQNDTNFNIKKQILEVTNKTKNTYINNLETIEKQNVLIEDNYNKIVDINNELDKSSSIISKIKRKICDCFTTKPRRKKNKSMNKIIINNKNSEVHDEKNIVNRKNIGNNNFEDKLLSDLDDIYNISRIQNKQIKNQNNILNKMDNNTIIVDNKIKKNHNEIKNI